MTDASLEETIELLNTQLLLRPNDAHKRFQLGNVLRRQGRIDEAITAFRRAVTIKPEFADAHFQLGLSYRDREDPTTALAYFNQAIAHKPEFLEALRYRAETCVLLEREEDALLSYEKVLELDPDDRDAPREAGIRRYRRGDYDKASVLLNRATQLEPERVELLVLLGLCFFRMGKMAPASAALSHFIERGGDSPVARSCLGEALATMGELPRAIQVCREGLEKYPQEYGLWFALGRYLAQRGQYEDAALALERAQPSPSNDLHSTYGRVLLALGRYSEAVTELREATRSGTATIDVIALGEALLATGASIPAVDTLERAVRAEPNDARTHVLLGNAYVAIDRPDDALKMLRKAEQLGDSRETLLLSIAELQEKLALGDEALATYGRVLAQNPESVPALYRVGYRTFAAGHHGDAIDPLREAARLAPNHADVQLTLGRALGAAARHIEASDALRRYVDLRPAEIPARLELARSLRAQGRAIEAIPLLEAATVFAPKDVDLYRELGVTYSAAKNANQAIGAYEKAVDLAPRDDDALERLAHELHAQKEYDRALTLATRALETRLNDPALHRLRGQIHADKGEDQRARSELERAHFLDPNNLELGKELGLVLARLGHADKAVPLLEASWSKGMTTPEIALALAGSLRELGRTDEALATLETARASHPEAAEALLQLAFLYEQRGDLDRAVVTYREVTRLRADAPEALDRAARAYLKLDMPDEAVQTLEQLIRARPGDAGAYFELGKAYAKLSNEEEAVLAWTRAAELRPTHLATWVELARAHARQRNLAASVDAYRQALRLEPSAREESLELAAVLDQLGKTAERADVLQKLGATRSDPQVLLELARAKAELGKTTEAVALFDTAVAVAPSEATVDPVAVLKTWTVVGSAYRKLDTSKKVTPIFERLALDARTAPADVVTFAEILRDLGKPKSALDVVTRVAKDPAPERAYRLVGALSNELGKHEEAADAWEHVVRDEPQAVDARFTLAKTFMTLRRRSEAIAALRGVVQVDPAHADAWSDLAELLGEQGDNYGELEALTELVRLRAHASCYRRLADAYTTGGRREEAVEAIRNAIRLEPRNASHRKALGLAYAQSEDARAVEALEDAISLDPSLHELRAVAAKIHRERGDHGRALAHLLALSAAHAHTAETWRALAETLVAMQRYNEAIDAVRRAAEAAPQDLEIKHLRATLAVQAKLYDEAARAYEEWLVDAPTDTEALAALAGCYGKLQRPEQAIRVLRNWVKAAPRRHEPHLELGLALLARGDYRAALESLDAAHAIRPDLPTALMGIAEAHASLGSLDKRAEALESYVRLVPQSAQAHAMLGEAYESLGRVDDAAEAYASAVERDPKNLDARARLADILARRGDYMAAALHVRALVEKRPSAKAWFDLARMERKLTRVGEALRCVERALDMDPGLAGAQTLKAALWAERGDVGPAKGLLEELVKRDPADFDARYELARIHYVAQEYAPARAHLRAITTRLPTHFDAQILLARVLEAIDNPAAAAECYADAAELGELSTEILMAWAGCLLATNDFHKAESVLKEAIANDESTSRAHLAIGMLYYRSGRAPEAVQAFSTALALSPDDAELCAALGAAHSKAGHHKEAADAYARAIELGRQTPEMHFQLGVALHRANNLTGAFAQVTTLDRIGAKELATRLRGMLG